MGVESPNWADVVAAAASTLGVLLAIAVPLLGGWRRHGAQLTVDARRLNDAMCVLDLTFRPTRTTGELRLDVVGLWPSSLFLLPEGGSRRAAPDGSMQIAADMLGKRRLRIWMEGIEHGAYSASAHVWAERPLRSAMLWAQIVERASAKRRISRLIRINPIT